MFSLELALVPEQWEIIQNPNPNLGRTCEVQADGSVLRRLNAIPDRYMLSPNYSDHVNNGSAFSELTGRDDFTLGTLRLDSLEVRRTPNRGNMYNSSPRNVES